MASKIKVVPSIKKISIKTVVGEVDLDAIPKKGAKLIMRAVGIATGIKTGSSNNGDWAALRGDFSATNIETGEEVRSSVCFIPGVPDMVARLLAHGDIKAVNFAFDIFVRKANTAAGYEYALTPLIDMGESDPLAAIIGGLPKLATSKARK